MSVDIRGSSASPSLAEPGFTWRATADQRVGRPKAPIMLAPLPPRPLVTVLIANFNYAGYVGRAIESVLAQSYEFLEVIVCDDGSTDNSCDVIAAYAERDIRVRLVSRPNGGMAAAWNTAFEASGGDIICLLDADDEFLPCKIESVVRRFTERANAGLVLHPLIVIDGTGQEIQQIPVLTKVEEGWIADRVLNRGGRWRTVPTSGIAFRRDLATYLFPIPEARFRWGADGFVVTLLPLLTEVAVVDGAFAYYRVHGGNDLGSFGFNAGVADRVVELVQATTAGVNERLAECGYDRVRIDPNRNLGLAEYALLRALSENESSRLLVRRCAALLRALFASDLYGRPQKLLKGIFFSISVLLPVSARKRWIGIALGHSRQKHAIQRLVSVLGGGR